MRDVAYEGLPFRRRRALHAQVGATIEAAAASPEQVSEVLSLHYFHAGRFDKAWSYSRTAGHRARTKFAHGEAAEFFARATESARRAADVPAQELGEALVALGDAHELCGRPAAAIDAFRAARRTLDGNPVTDADLLLRQARIHQRRGKLPQSLRLLTVALRLLEGVEGGAARATRSRLATRYSFGRLMQGRRADALRWGGVAAREAEDSGDKATLAHAYNGLHSVHAHAGTVPDMPYGRLALLAYEELGDLAGQGHSANNLGVEALGAGRWVDAQALFERASGSFARLGDEANQANALYNQADVLVRQGHLAEAEPLLLDALRVARAVEDEELVGLAEREHARVCAGTGRFDEARRQLAAARGRFTALGATAYQTGVAAGEAECRLLAGRPDEARAVLDPLLDADAGADDHVLLRRVRGAALLAAGRHDEAAADFLAVVDSPEQTEGCYDLGLALLGLSLLTEQPARRDELRRRGRAVLELLGVVATPGLPGDA
jgi:tetratricopeptide (TPR) repeat protein